MTELQVWTLAYIPPAAVVFITLLRIFATRATEARKSRDFYSYTLLLVLAWMLLSMALQNIPEQYLTEARLASEASSMATSLAVLCFVVSTIYFVRPPKLWEKILVSLPLLVVLFAVSSNSFEAIFISYWWVGQISNSALNFLSTLLTVGVILYGLARLAALRPRVVSSDVRRRLSFLIISLSTALASSLAVYLLEQVLALPPLETIATGLSILVSYPAFNTRAT